MWKNYCEGGKEQKLVAALRGISSLTAVAHEREIKRFVFHSWGGRLLNEKITTTTNKIIIEKLPQ